MLNHEVQRSRPGCVPGRKGRRGRDAACYILPRSIQGGSFGMPNRGNSRPEATNATLESTLIEANGRFWGSLPLSIAAGADFPRFLFQMLGSMAELDRATTLEQLTRGRDRIARAGEWVNGPIPYGYDLNEDRQLIRSQRWIADGLTESEVVRGIFERIAGGRLCAEASTVLLG